MSTLLKTLIEKRAATWEQGKSLLNTVEAEARDLTAEESEQWSKITADLDEYDKRITDLDEIEQRNAQADEVRSRYAGAADEQRQGDADDSEAVLLRQIARGEKRAHTFSGPGNADRRSLTKGTATDGQELVPTSFYPQLVQHLVQTSAIRRAGATVITTESGENLQVPKTTSFSTASIVGEGSQIGDSDPQFGQVTLGAYKYAFLVGVSRELIEDEAVGLAAFLAEQGGVALGRGSDAHFVTGNGSTQPQGVVAAATVGKTGAAAVAGAFTADDLIDLYYSVIEAYRVGASWLMSDTAIAAARKLKDPATGQYLWQPGLSAGEPPTLLGRPLHSDHNVAAPAATVRSVLFGDFSRYFIRDVRGVRVESTDAFQFDDDIVTYKFVLRTDGDLTDTTGAIKAFVGGAAS